MKRDMSNVEDGAPVYVASVKPLVNPRKYIVNINGKLHRLKNGRSPTKYELDKMKSKNAIPQYLDHVLGSYIQDIVSNGNEIDSVKFILKKNSPDLIRIKFKKKTNKDVEAKTQKKD